MHRVTYPVSIHDYLDSQKESQLFPSRNFEPNETAPNKQWAARATARRHRPSQLLPVQFAKRFPRQQTTALSARREAGAEEVEHVLGREMGQRVKRLALNLFDQH